MLRFIPIAAPLCWNRELYAAAGGSALTSKPDYPYIAFALERWGDHLFVGAQALQLHLPPVPASETTSSTKCGCTAPPDR